MQQRNRKRPPGKAGGGRMMTGVPDSQVLKSILEGDVESLVTWADSIGRGLHTNERLTTSQVRGLFGEVRQIEADVRMGTEKLPDNAYRRFFLLKPKLAYQAQREREARKGEGVARLEQILSPAIDMVGEDANRFRYFVDFFEAILAYHKAAGGRE